MTHQVLKKLVESLGIASKLLLVARSSYAITKELKTLLVNILIPNLSSFAGKLFTFLAYEYLIHPGEEGKWRFRKNGPEYSYISTEVDNKASINLFTKKFNTPSTLVRLVFARCVKSHNRFTAIKLNPQEFKAFYPPDSPPLSFSLMTSTRLYKTSSISTHILPYLPGFWGGFLSSFYLTRLSHRWF
ncbi:unnamed protein product [Malus baccata var. baccata]